jgi:hypothetical protein
MSKNVKIELNGGQFVVGEKKMKGGDILYCWLTL